MVRHAVLAYSGGLDTSVAVHWIKAQYDADVTAVMVDLGQPGQDLEGARERALANGAEDCIVVSARDAFADEFIAPAIKANALYEGAYPLGTALSRPLIGRELVAVAQDVGADAVAHGCTGKGNDQVRIETAVRALAPGLTVLAPQRSHPMDREAVLAYAAEHSLKLPTIKSSPYSVDENLWTRSVEGGDLEDPATPINEQAYRWTSPPADAPDESLTITLEFEAGLPVRLNGRGIALAELCEQLNTSAGEHGIGRIDHIENRLVGIKSREVYEAPAAAVILAAKRALETITLTRGEDEFKPTLEAKFSQLTYDGLWYAPVMEAVQAFVSTVQTHVTGTVTLEAYKGNLTVLGRESPLSLYDAGLATYGAEDAFDHQASEGFIQVWSLPGETATAKRLGAAPPKKTEEDLS